MTSDAEYSTDANGVRKVNKADNARRMSLIRNHGKIPFKVVRDNMETYVKQSTLRAQDSIMMYE